jgi:NitT/TauT family transport system substrate-binding protein
MNHLSFKTLAQQLRVGAGIGLALAALLTGCASAAAPAPAATKPPADKVTVQLSWTHSSEFAAFYMAKDKNYYADEGLDVDLLPSGYDAAGNYIDPVKQVTSGKADFGLLEGMNVLAARDAGTPIVAIATNYKRHPVAFTSLAEKK